MTRTVTAANAFPLRWPPGQPRNKTTKRAKFQISSAAARADLLAELAKLGARGVVLSTNVMLRRDGLPYADVNPADAGVCVYFELQLEPGAGAVEHEIACDAWNHVKDNIRAIGLTVSAIRGIERWGSTSLMKRVFSAFRMLPAGSNGARPWREVLGVDAAVSLELARLAFRTRAFQAHPDQGGSHERMAELNAAMAAAEAELGRPT